MKKLLVAAMASLVFAIPLSAGTTPADPAALPRAAQEEYDLGVTAADQKEWALAIRHFAAAQAAAPDSAKVLYNLGVAHSQLDHLAGAAWLNAYLALPDRQAGAEERPGAEKTARVQKEIRRLDSAARLKVEKILDTTLKIADQYVLPIKAAPNVMPWLGIPTAAPWAVGSDMAPAPLLHIDDDLKQTEANMKWWLKLDVVDCAACVLSPEAALALDKEVRVGAGKEASQQRDEARCFQYFRQLWELEDYAGALEVYGQHKALFDRHAAIIMGTAGEQLSASNATCVDSIFRHLLFAEKRTTLGDWLTRKAQDSLKRPLTPADWIKLATSIDAEERKLDIDGHVAAATKDARSVTCRDIAYLAVQLGRCRLKIRALERIAEAQAAGAAASPADK